MSISVTLCAVPLRTLFTPRLRSRPLGHSHTQLSSGTVEVDIFAEMLDHSLKLANFIDHVSQLVIIILN